MVLPSFTITLFEIIRENWSPLFQLSGLISSLGNYYQIDPSYALIARKKIPKDSLIVQERCLLVLHESPALNDFRDRNSRLDQIGATFQVVPDKGRKYLKALHPGTGGQRVMTETNHYTHESGGHTVRRYYHVISNVRHSCQPNAVLVYNAEDQSVFLQSIRKIKNKEEICVSYAGMDDPRKEAYMRAAYSIQCAQKCHTCTPQGQSSHSSVMDTAQNSDDDAQKNLAPQHNGHPRPPASHAPAPTANQQANPAQNPAQNQPPNRQPNPRPNPQQTGQSNPPDNDSCCGCGLFSGIKRWFSEFGHSHGVQRQTIPL